MTSQELKELLKNNELYKDFNVLPSPVKFGEYFKGKNIDVVQLYSIQTYGDNICGFCGQCSWKNNEIRPLDGDSYSSEMTVYGYEWFQNKEEDIKGLNILIGDDW